MTTYVVGGGCFWCADAVFRSLRGVSEVISGYSGGSAETATYAQVCSGTTEHVESVQVTFDEIILPRQALLDIFFLTHDPTSRDRQGGDAGSQYASVMLYANDSQKTEFMAAVERAKERWDAPIVTRIEPLKTFYPAEIPHQDYYYQNPNTGYCQIVIEPKIRKARNAYQHYFKETT